MVAVGWEAGRSLESDAQEQDVQSVNVARERSS